MTDWLNAIDQIQKPYTFAVDHGVNDVIATRTCPHCSTVFEVRRNHRNKKYCSYKCGMAARRTEYARNEGRPCPYCGGLVVAPKGSRRKYCSPQCRVRYLTLFAGKVK